MALVKRSVEQNPKLAAKNDPGYFVYEAGYRENLLRGGGRTAIYLTLHRFCASEPIPLGMFLPSRSWLTRFSLIFWCLKIHVSKLGKIRKFEKVEIPRIGQSTFFSVFGSKNRLRHFFSIGQKIVFSLTNSPGNELLRSVMGSLAYNLCRVTSRIPLP